MYGKNDYRGPEKSLLWEMQDFFDTGGKVVTHESTPCRACVTVSHPETCSITIEEERDDAHMKATDEIWQAYLSGTATAKGIVTVYDPIKFEHWKNFTISHAGIQYDDPVFDKYKVRKIIY